MSDDPATLVPASAITTTPGAADPDAAPAHNETRERLAMQLHQTMLRQGMMPDDLATRAGISSGTVLALLFCGPNVAGVTLGTVDAIAQALGVRFEYAFAAGKAA